MKKKILSLLTLLCMVTVLLSANMITVSAYGGKYGDYLYYRDEGNGEVTITDCDTSATEIVIPEEIDEKKVTSIGNYAFRNCSGLTDITIPNSVTSIGEYAFGECRSLQTVFISDLTAYLNCTYGKYSSNPMHYATVLRLNGNLIKGDLKIPNGVTQIPSYAFINCSGLTSVTIPNSVTSIGEHAFNHCSGLTSITLPNSVTSIGHYAFRNCSGLTDITIPNSVTSIGEYAFYYCTGLTNITLPNSVTSIGESAFRNCTELTSVTIPNSVTSIGSAAFECTGLTSITIPNSVTSIGSSAFACTELTSVTIPNSVTSIGGNAFFNCPRLTGITLPNSVTSIDSSTFGECTALTGITIPNSVTSIGHYAFENCNNLSIIFYTGSQDEWENIYIGSGNDTLNNVAKVYNSVLKTYKFETNCESTLADISDYAVMTAPKVTNEGKTLVGWYDNKSLTGNPVSFPYYGNATTLYAAWTDKTGQSFEDAFTAKANMQYNVVTTKSGQLVYYEFVPRLTGEYRFYSTGNLDTYGYLYDGNKNQLTSNDDDGDGNNFKIVYNLTAGETYYIAAKLYSGSGSFTLVTETDCIESTKTVCVTATTGEKIFISTPNYLPENAAIILACYKNNALIEVMTAPNKNQTLYFITRKDFDSAKVMVWNNLDDITPLCDAEILEQI